MSDIFQHFGCRKHGAETSQFYHIIGLTGQTVHLIQSDIQAYCHLLQEGTCAGRTFAVHFKTGAPAGLIDFDNFIVLSADINDRAWKGKVKEGSFGVTTDFRFRIAGKGYIISTVAGRYRLFNVTLL